MYSLIVFCAVGLFFSSNAMEQATLSDAVVKTAALQTQEQALLRGLHSLKRNHFIIKRGGKALEGFLATLYADNTEEFFSLINAATILENESIETAFFGFLEKKRALEMPAKFIQAAAAGQRDKVLWFLDNGVDVNAQDQKGNTALIAAAEAGHIQTVELLLQHGADVSIEPIYGGSALQSAVYHPRLFGYSLLPVLT